MNTTSSLDSDVQRLLELQDVRNQLDNEITAIKARLADNLSAGSHPIAGVTVVVKQPSRRFNLEKALQHVPADVLPSVLRPDPKLVKAHLTPVVLDECMDPGAGAPTVSVA